MLRRHPFRRRPPRQKAGAAQVAARQHEATAIRLRAAGATYAQIGTQLKMTEAGAYKCVFRALARLAASQQEAAEHVRTLEEERLDMAARALAQRVLNGELGAIDRWLRLSESRRRLWGADAPTKIAPTTPDGTAPYDDLAGFRDRLIAQLMAVADPSPTPDSSGVSQ